MTSNTMDCWIDEMNFVIFLCEKKVSHGDHEAHEEIKLFSED